MVLYATDLLLCSTSIRCLRLMMAPSDARKQLEEMNGPEILNQAVLENSLDDFVKNDVKAIFSTVYGGENAVKRIAIANVQIVVEMMKENLESAIVQLAGVKRLCQLLTNANAILYTPQVLGALAANDQTTTAVEAIMAASEDAQTDQKATADAIEKECAPLFRDMDTFGAVPLVTTSLSRFDVDSYLSLYVHVCRFISFVAVEGTLVSEFAFAAIVLVDLWLFIHSHPLFSVVTLCRHSSRAQYETDRTAWRRGRHHSPSVQSARDAAPEETGRARRVRAAEKAPGERPRRVVEHLGKQPAQVCTAATTSGLLRCSHESGISGRGGLHTHGDRTANDVGVGPSRDLGLQRVHDEAAQAQVPPGGDPLGPGWPRIGRRADRDAAPATHSLGSSWASIAYKRESARAASNVDATTNRNQQHAKCQHLKRKK